MKVWCKRYNASFGDEMLFAANEDRMKTRSTWAAYFRMVISEFADKHPTIDAASYYEPFQPAHPRRSQFGLPEDLAVWMDRHIDTLRTDSGSIVRYILKERLGEKIENYSVG